jgi:hypothetical protein
VKNRFQNLPFKFSLQRYNVDVAADLVAANDANIAAGLCTLNQVDP